MRPGAGGLKAQVNDASAQQAEASAIPVKASQLTVPPLIGRIPRKSWYLLQTARYAR